MTRTSATARRTTAVTASTSHPYRWGAISMIHLTAGEHLTVTAGQLALVAEDLAEHPLSRPASHWTGDPLPRCRLHGGQETLSGPARLGDLGPPPLQELAGRGVPLGRPGGPGGDLPGLVPRLASGLHRGSDLRRPLEVLARWPCSSIQVRISTHHRRPRTSSSNVVPGATGRPLGSHVHRLS